MKQARERASAVHLRSNPISVYVFACNLCTSAHNQISDSAYSNILLHIKKPHP
ncbi:hypothetical protein C8R48DRAFT_691805 [Suillus tomentosus]|nr:hypothetical protein C8R48DRAFT_691805 [Suillus tomentosus]